MLSSPIASMTWRSGLSSASVATTHWRKKYWLGGWAIWIREPGPNISHAPSTRRRDHRPRPAEPPEVPRQPPARALEERAAQPRVPLEDAAGGHAAEGHHQLDRVAARHPDDAAVRGVEVAAGDVVAQRGLPGRVKAHRHPQ